MYEKGHIKYKVINTIEINREMRGLCLNDYVHKMCV